MIGYDKSLFAKNAKLIFINDNPESLIRFGRGTIISIKSFDFYNQIEKLNIIASKK